MTTFSLNPDDIIKIIDKEHILHPRATLRDYYKLLFQSFWGQGHLLMDPTHTKELLLSELNNMKEDYFPLLQDIGNGKGYYRVSLSVLRLNYISLDIFLSLFLRFEFHEKLAMDWLKFWNDTMINLLKCYPDLVDEKEILLCQNAAQSKQIISHSESFRLTYKPHYRVMLLTGKISLDESFRRLL